MIRSVFVITRSLAALRGGRRRVYCTLQTLRMPRLACLLLLPCSGCRVFGYQRLWPLLPLLQSRRDSCTCSRRLVESCSRIVTDGGSGGCTALHLMRPWLGPWLPGRSGGGLGRPCWQGRCDCDHILNIRSGGTPSIRSGCLRRNVHRAGTLLSRTGFNAFCHGTTLRWQCGKCGPRGL